MNRIVLLLMAFGLFLLSACATPTDATTADPAPVQPAAQDAAPQTELAQPAAPAVADCTTVGPQTDGSICSATCSGGRIVRVTDETSCTAWSLSATATPEPWPANRQVVRTDDLGGGNFVNWFEEPSYSAVFLMAAPVALSDGPLPIGEAVVGGMLFYVWYQTVGQEALIAAGAEVANGLEDLRLKILAKAAESDPFAIQMDPSIPYASESEMIATDWIMLPPAWMSILHPESKALINGAWMRSSNGTLQANNSQGCETGMISAGTICLFAALNDPGNGQMFEGSAAGLVGSGPNVVFLAVNGQVRSTPPGPGEMGWERLGTSQYYMLKSSMYWKCAWWMSQRISNGHGSVPPEFRLEAGAGWARWQEVKTRYGLVFPIASISLPANPFK